MIWQSEPDFQQGMESVSQFKMNTDWKSLAIDEFQINEINVDLHTSGFDNEVLSVDACAVWWAWVVLLSTSHRCCDLTQRASVSMRKCADWVNLKFVYRDLIMWSVIFSHWVNLKSWWSFSHQQIDIKLYFSRYCRLLSEKYVYFIITFPKIALVISNIVMNYSEVD